MRTHRQELRRKLASKREFEPHRGSVSSGRSRSLEPPREAPPPLQQADVDAAREALKSLYKAALAARPAPEGATPSRPPSPGDEAAHRERERELARELAEERGTAGRLQAHSELRGRALVEAEEATTVLGLRLDRCQSARESGEASLRGLAAENRVLRQEAAQSSLVPGLAHELEELRQHSGRPTGEGGPADPGGASQLRRELDEWNAECRRGQALFESAGMLPRAPGRESSSILERLCCEAADAFREECRACRSVSEECKAFREEEACAVEAKEHNLSKLLAAEARAGRCRLDRAVAEEARSAMQAHLDGWRGECEAGRSSLRALGAEARALQRGEEDLEGRVELLRAAHAESEWAAAGSGARLAEWQSACQRGQSSLDAVRTELRGHEREAADLAAHCRGEVAEAVGTEGRASALAERLARECEQLREEMAAASGACRARDRARTEDLVNEQARARKGAQFNAALVVELSGARDEAKQLLAECAVLRRRHTSAESLASKQRAQLASCHAESEDGLALFDAARADVRSQRHGAEQALELFHGEAAAALAAQYKVHKSAEEARAELSETREEVKQLAMERATLRRRHTSAESLASEQRAHLARWRAECKDGLAHFDAACADYRSDRRDAEQRLELFYNEAVEALAAECKACGGSSSGESDLRRRNGELSARNTELSAHNGALLRECNQLRAHVEAMEQARATIAHGPPEGEPPALAMRASGADGQARSCSSHDCLSGTEEECGLLQERATSAESAAQKAQQSVRKARRSVGELLTQRGELELQAQGLQSRAACAERRYSITKIELDQQRSETQQELRRIPELLKREEEQAADSAEVKREVVSCAEMGLHEIRQLQHRRLSVHEAAINKLKNRQSGVMEEEEQACEFEEEEEDEEDRGAAEVEGLDEWY